MKIGGLQRTTLIDYPGKIAATVFLSGCSFRCSWCYSPELVLPERIAKQPKISEKEFFDFLKTKKGLLEGIVVCGGEPTINKELPDFIKKIKDSGFCVKLDTNGSNPDMIESLIKNKIVDYVAMDVKASLKAGPKFQISNFNFQSNSNYQNSRLRQGFGGQAKYEMATNAKVDLSKIEKSVEIIKNSGIDYEFRTTVVPSIHTKEDIIQIARDIGPAKKYYLQSFRPEKTINPEFLKIKPYPDDFLRDIVKEISPFFEVCGLK